DDPGMVLGSAVSSGLPAPVVKGTGVELPPGCSLSASFFENLTVTPIVDNTTFTTDIVVAGAGTYLWDMQLVTEITHTFPGDLDITLTSPAGTEVTITTDNGGTNDDSFNGTQWDDDAGDITTPGPATDHTYSIGVTSTPLVVEEALAAFVGEDPNGTWTLSVGDDATLDSGSLNSWGLELATLSTAPTFGTTTSVTEVAALPINDNTTFDSTLTMAGADAFLCDADLETFITHTFPGDLDITLTSPAGTVVTITTDNGGTNDDSFNGTTWDDDAGDITTPGPATDHTYSIGVTSTPLVVEEAMAAFRGEDPNGLWTLTVGDDATLDQGNLAEWTLSVTGCSCAGGFDPEIPTQNPAGLALLALLLLGAGVLAFRRLG
ncbi:MAG: IPTL-CTERM sorting domain-containing protein, partial [Holophagales bacterium]|nr:IPTL-CTERM sorting domain-containing protein [Holophagales bacterium]